MPDRLTGLSPGATAQLRRLLKLGPDAGDAILTARSSSSAARGRGSVPGGQTAAQCLAPLDLCPAEAYGRKQPKTPRRR